MPPIRLENNKNFIKTSILPHKNIILVLSHVFTVEEKGMAHLLVILRKTTTTLKWYGSQKDLQSTLTHKDPIKFGYLSQKLDYVGVFEEGVVHR